MPQPEAVLSRKIIETLRERYPLSFWSKISGGPFQRTLPDIVGCVQGRFCGFETKMPGKHPTPRQQHVLDTMQAAGGIVGVIYSADDAIALIERDRRVLMLVTYTS